MRKLLIEQYYQINLNIDINTQTQWLHDPRVRKVQLFNWLAPQNDHVG